MRKHFLVIGDWFVDNYWVCAPQRNKTASRTGEQYVRSLHSFGSSVRALCGAGEVVSIFAQSDGNSQYVTGIGHWHPEDTKHLTALLFPDLCLGDNPYRINPAIRYTELSEEQRRQVRLFPILPDSECVGTNRVWRIFEHQLDGHAHRLRIDWVMEPKPAKPTNAELEKLIEEV